LASRVSGSADLFNHRGRKPWASINFVTAHDGFTLHDLVSYEQKHNEANGEENRDGNSDNRSSSYGHEGPTDDAAIVEVRERQKRNFLSTLLLSQGTPMILAGDEIGRTQRGNNNAYCQDNEISWMDWTPHEDGERLTAFVQRITKLRSKYPVLRQRRFLSGTWDEELGVKDCSWLTPNGDEMTPQHWADPAAKCCGLLLDGRAQTSGIRRRGSEDTLLAVINAHHDVVVFTLPKAQGGRAWRRLVDTNLPDADDEYDRPAMFKFGRRYQVTGRSFLLFLLRAERPPQRSTAFARSAPRPGSAKSS
jgi:isoamylase